MRSEDEREYAEESGERAGESEPSPEKRGDLLI